jgi:acyl carrier protein
MTAPDLEANAVCEALREYVRGSILAEGVALDNDTPLASLGIDSVSLVEILLFVERRFGVSVPDEDLTRENLHSVLALARCVERASDGQGRRTAGE